MEEVNGILVAAYELKAPLAVLRQLALSLSFDGLSVEDKKVQEEMVGVSERALKQINDLMKVPRLEESLFPMEPVAVRAVCDDAVNEITSLFRAGELEIKYQNRSRLVFANRELLASVIYNFLTNAMHYVGRGAKAEMVVKERDGRVRVTIRDFGPALPMNTWREIKAELISGPKSVAMRPGSSGLGLYIASKFAKYMDAKVGAVRHRDGTSFFVDLPVSKQMDIWSAI
ncbi:MAG: HAMP domain-containing sensor histidine kinase [Candidatus Saccharibacteria bacterium]|nr:HAMP domain-containing sensor histidine kinase [Candidatus Saccharibacteria bacterium]